MSTTAQAPAVRLRIARPVAITSRGVSFALLALAIICALALIAPGQTITTRYLPDLLQTVDHIHRVASGQIPGRDFFTPLGPLAVYLPALGEKLSGSYGAAMPTAMAVMMLALAPVIAHVATSRLHPLLALIYGALLILILAAPANPGESITALSFAKFYNRIGWVAISTLLVLYLEPRTRSVTAADAACAILLTLVALTTKATYGLAAVGFLVFMLLDTRQRQWVMPSVAGVAIVTAVIALIWGGTRQHFEALALSIEISGAVRGSWGQIVDHLLLNLSDYVLATLFAGIALTQTRSLRDLVFFLSCGVGGFLLVNQNFQAWGIFTLHAASVVAAERILRALDGASPLPEARRWTSAAGAKLLFLLLAAPPIAHFALTLALHTGAAIADSGRPAPTPFGHLRIADMWTGGDLRTADVYLTNVEEGVRALNALSPRPTCVVSLDIANPFSAALGLQPAHGDSSWLQWERTVGPPSAALAPSLLDGAMIVMEPKPAASSDPAAARDTSRVGALFQETLAADFELAQETERWIIHRRRAPQTLAGCDMAQQLGEAQ
ncbi:MAG: hypothetical protein Q8M31_00155 [Beijerinckiaceae bacterium]|nr:hypothetical protein [Beijerinckiaceae bacterium]